MAVIVFIDMDACITLLHVSDEVIHVESKILVDVIRDIKWTLLRIRAIDVRHKIGEHGWAVWTARLKMKPRPTFVT